MLTTDMRTTQYKDISNVGREQSVDENPAICLNSQDAVSSRSVLFIRTELQDRKMSSTYSMQSCTNA